MRATIIAVGSELLGADRADTNSLFLADRLAGHGVGVVRKVIVGDRGAEIELEIDRARAEAELILITGGLGPTRDDLTREAVARAVGRELIRDQTLIEDIRRKFACFGREMPAVNERQADVIDGAMVLDNPRGTAPGLRLTVDDSTLFLFPGVPHELEGLAESALEPWLAERETGDRIERRVFRVACLGESALEEVLEPLYSRFGEEGVSLLPSRGEVSVGLVARGSRDACARWLEPRERLLESVLGDFVFARDPEESLEAVVGGMLMDRDLTVATAESCTGGLIAQRLTAVAGSSAYFVGGAVTYSNELKVRLLGVPPEMIEAHGAVSAEVARAMATGACRELGADYALAVTGIAGPGGGTAEKPVGTVHIALASRDGTERVDRRVQLPGDRRRVRRLTSQWALDLLRRRLAGHSGRAQKQQQPNAKMSP